MTLAGTLPAAFAVPPLMAPAFQAMLDRCDAVIGEWTASPAEKVEMSVEVAIVLTQRRWGCGRAEALTILERVAAP